MDRREESLSDERRGGGARPLGKPAGATAASLAAAVAGCPAAAAPTAASWSAAPPAPAPGGGKALLRRRPSLLRWLPPAAPAVVEPGGSGRARSRSTISLAVGRLRGLVARQSRMSSRTCNGPSAMQTTEQVQSMMSEIGAMPSNGLWPSSSRPLWQPRTSAGHSSGTCTSRSCPRTGVWAVQISCRREATEGEASGCL